ncbi:hypothetical protein ECPA28_3037, partial [Escherichia coli PA28]
MAVSDDILTLIFVCPRNSAGFFYSFYLCRPIT